MRTGGPATLVNRNSYESGGETFVPMMQAADFRDGGDLSDSAWHNRA